MLRRILSRVTFTGVTRVFQAGNGCISSKKGMGFQRSGCSKVQQPVQGYNYSRVDVESEVDRSN